jgi:hypothetical protein
MSKQNMNKAERLSFLKACIEKQIENKLLSIESPYLNEACHFIGWYLSPPCQQWNYYHVITESGGVLPFDVDYLLSKINLAIRTENTTTH